MTITGLAYGLSALVGAGIIVVGARFLIAPRAAAAGYGLPLHSGQRRPARRSHLHPHQHTARHPGAQQETQAGPLPAAGRAVLGPSLHRATQRWLENLAATAPATLASPAQGHSPRTGWHS